MSRILLVDDSPHAQRMGERILTEEGYEVVTVSNADSALVRLEDVDPDVVLADTVMPGRTGYDICQYLKMSPRHRHVRVLLTAGVLEPLDDERVKRVEADGAIKKPFEATALLAAVKPLAEAAVAARDRSRQPEGPRAVDKAPEETCATPFVAVVDAEQVKAAVTVALDASMDSIVEQISRYVLQALQTRKPESERLVEAGRPAQAPAPPPATGLKVVEPPPAVPRAQAVRRVTPFRLRSGSILGLDIVRPEPEVPGPRPETAAGADPQPPG